MDFKIFTIVAHVDHGKSTLADRIIEITSGQLPNFKKKQYLDELKVEQKRQITIKLSAVQLRYQPRIDRPMVTLQLIDTPGHYDFTAEVIRSFSICQIAIVLIDCSQGIEAQTIQHLNWLKKNRTTIIPVINKIDLDVCSLKEISKIKKEFQEYVGSKNFIQKWTLISAKTGKNVNQLINLITRATPNKESSFCKLKREIENTFKEAKKVVMIFDADYSLSFGIKLLAYVWKGEVKNGEKLFFENNQRIKINKTEIHCPEKKLVDVLKKMELGWIITNPKEKIRSVIIEKLKRQNRFFLTDKSIEKAESLSNKMAQPAATLISINLFSEIEQKFNELEKAVKQINISDPSFFHKKILSPAFGPGIQCNFTGMLHLNITIERIQDELGQQIIVSPAQTSLLARNKKDSRSWKLYDNPNQINPTEMEIKEPFIKLRIEIPLPRLAKILDFLKTKRAQNIETRETKGHYPSQIMEVRCLLPLSETVWKFTNDLKSLSKGEGKINDEGTIFLPSIMVKIEFFLNQAPIPELDIICPKGEEWTRGKYICQLLKNNLERQGFEIRIQAKVNKKVVASEKTRAWRKDVTARLYGGDVTRKKKLLEKQREGKKKMRKRGIPNISRKVIKKIFEVFSR